MERRERWKLTRVQLLEDIVEHIQKDYAGADWLEGKGAHVPFLGFVAAMEAAHQLSDATFFDFVQLYLQAQGGTGLRFQMEDHGDFRNFERGFRVRGSGEELLVTESEREERLRPGDRIVRINGMSPARYRSANSLQDRVLPLQDRMEWDAFLCHASSVTVEREGGVLEKIRLASFAPRKKTPRCCAQLPSEGEVLLTLEGFPEEEELEAFLEQYRGWWQTCRRLVLDLRKNGGGPLAALAPLLPFLQEEPLALSDFLGEERVLVRYSRGNCEQLREELLPYLQAAEEQTREMAKQFLQELEENEGRDIEETLALLEETPQEQAERYARWQRKRQDGWRVPETVEILLDKDSRGESELFARCAARFSQVALSGEEPSGEADYSQWMTVDYGYGIRFSYPAAVRSEVAAKKGVLPGKTQ